MQGNKSFLTPAPLITVKIANLRPKVKIFGVPFDSTSTYRTGSRFGPNAIREAFMNIEIYSKTLGFDLEHSSIEDLGNIKHTSNVDKMILYANEATRKILSDGYIPILLGGEHTLTFAAFDAMPNNTALVIFDAHLDVRNEYDDLKMMHATFLRRLIEKHPRVKVVHVGSRAATKEEWRFVISHKVSLITADDVLTSENFMNNLKSVLKDIESVYVSIDLDVLDPAYAPGVANPEVCGITMHTLLNVLYHLRGKDIQGFDIVELCPQYDPSGITAIAAAKLLAELCCLVNLE